MFNQDREYLSSSEFVLNSKTVIISDQLPQVEFLRTEVRNLLSYDLQLLDEMDDQETIQNSIEFGVTTDHLVSESYEITVTGSKITVRGGSISGLMHGLQSLLQIFYETSLESTTISIPPFQIGDFPRFEWRGFMLDEARHFQGKDIIMELLSLMSLLKLNKFHWHLTDDQGWRIEIESFPKLTEVGSTRGWTRIGGLISMVSHRTDRNVHSGYYTKEDIRDIVAYASDLGIEIIPEIDMPGHSTAMIASYPRLSCSGKDIDVPGNFGIKKDILCAGNEEVYSFIEVLVDEISALFPSKYFHMGGDEAPKQSWSKCEKCQLRIEQEELEDEEDLRAYFMNRVAKLLIERGKEVIFWNDGLHKNIDHRLIGQYWLFKKKEVMKEITSGRRFIISKFFNMYLDYNYYLTPLSKVYSFDPVPEKLTGEHRKVILGVEAPLWTEWVRDRDRLYWQILPRLLAVAEVGWTIKALRDYPDFKKRISPLLKLLQSKGIPFASTETVDPGLLSRIFHVFTHLRNPKMRLG